MFSRPLFWILTALSACLLAAVFLVIRRMSPTQPPKPLAPGYVYVPSGSGLGELAQALLAQGYVADTLRFRQEALALGIDTVRAGRFLVPQGLPLRELLSRLDTLPNDPVRLVLQGFRTKAALAGFVGRQLECDSTEIAAALSDSALLAANGFTTENALAGFVPNTYHVFWNTSAREVVKRMFRESARFWNEERLAKARKQGINTKEAYILASILEKETNRDDEKRRMAGVYLNRLRTKQWRLEADPTVIFAVGDFSIRRLRPEHLSFDSPYNTYRYAGLPPGPICMASIASIDAVLEAEKHDYWFFCAKVDGTGYHHFSRNLNEHREYAKLWHQKMDREGVR